METMTTESKHMPDSMRPWFAKEIIPQIILNEEGNSWMGFYTTDKSFLHSIEQCKLSDGNFFVLDQKGVIKAIQKTLECALFYMTSDTVLIHKEKQFIPCLGFNKHQTDFLIQFQKRLNSVEDYAQKVWEVVKRESNQKDELIKLLEELLPKLSQLQDESAFTLPEKVEKAISKAKGQGQ